MKIFKNLDEVFDTMDEVRIYLERFDQMTGTEDDMDMLESIQEKCFDIKGACEELRDEIDNELAKKSSTEDEEEEEEETDTKST